jgi:rhomboid family GlyGly-CTERM serine protease
VSARSERVVRGAGLGPAPLRACLLTTLLSALAALFSLLPDSGAGLAYDRAAIAAGEFWRLVTGHFVHWSPGHLIWDVGTFLVLGAACEMRSRRRFLACVAGSVLVIPVAVWLWLPELRLYAGLSGIDAALFALLGTEVVREQWQRNSPTALGIALALCLALSLKIGFEMTNGGTVFVGDLAPGIAPVPLAHLVGGLIGVLAAALGNAPGSDACRLSPQGSHAAAPSSA